MFEMLVAFIILVAIAAIILFVPKKPDAFAHFNMKY